jgi:hypothetical protein
VGYGAGLTFDPYSGLSLQKAIQEIAVEYETFANAASAIDFVRRDEDQVNVYLKAVRERAPK